MESGSGLSMPKSKVIVFCFCMGLPCKWPWDAGIQGSNSWGCWVRVWGTYLW